MANWILILEKFLVEIPRKICYVLMMLRTDKFDKKVTNWKFLTSSNEGTFFDSSINTIAPSAAYFRFFIVYASLLRSHPSLANLNIFKNFFNKFLYFVPRANWRNGWRTNNEIVKNNEILNEPNKWIILQYIKWMIWNFSTIYIYQCNNFIIPSIQKFIVSAFICTFARKNSSISLIIR